MVIASKLIELLRKQISVILYDPPVNSELQALYAPIRFNGNYTHVFVTILSQEIFLCSTTA